MYECSLLKSLPRSFCELTSLKHVIYDEKDGIQWVLAKKIVLLKIRVKIIEVQFGLDWIGLISDLQLETFFLEGDANMSDLIPLVIQTFDLLIEHINSFDIKFDFSIIIAM